MVIRLMLATAMAACAGRAAFAAGDPDSPYRPRPQVLLDPPAYYSPLLYREMGEPLPGDWKKEHPEPVQSFAQYASSRPVGPTAERHTIVVAPLAMNGRQAACLPVLCEFLHLYFTLPVRMAPPLDLKGVTSRRRQMFGRAVTQYLTDDILHQVLKPALPRDALCLLGVTMEDLYPEPSWNYVFGQASLANRVGVYSLVRFYPEFWGQEATPEADRRGLLRSLHTLVHETGHMFGVYHCQKYECVMNGTNSLEESDRRPLHLCPECLKKFRWNIGFDVIARYEGLRGFYEKHDMKAEAAWVDKRIRQCRSEKVAP